METLCILGFYYYSFYPVTTSFIRFVRPRFGLRLRLLLILFRLLSALFRLHVYLVIFRVWRLAFFTFFLLVGLSYYPLLYTLVFNHGVDPYHAVFIGRCYVEFFTYFLTGDQN